MFRFTRPDIVQLKVVLKEIQIMYSTSGNENIIQYLGSFIESNHIYIVMEYAD